MENQKSKLTGIMDTEMFGDDNCQFYFDIKMARSKKHYLRITRRDKMEDDSYKRTQIILFEDDLGLFVEAISMLLVRFSHGQTGLVN